MSSYDSLPKDLKNYLSSRFTAHGLDPELAYDNLVPWEVKLQGPDMVREFMHHKHISHIYPQSEYPDLADEIDNVFLEDPYENLSRGCNVATPSELFNARLDNTIDAFDRDWNDDGILDGGIFDSIFS
ncbi:hypothetical protein NIES22_63020 [Calothrix brevissima NIES-22]|nr:hypothetical protein NIES22_63020 [Calothrix brevissima NIES-22]